MARTLKSTSTKTAKKTGYTKKGSAVNSLAVTLKSGTDRTLIAEWVHRSRTHIVGYTYDWEYWAGQRKAQTKAQKKAGKQGDPIWLQGGSGTLSILDCHISGNTFRYEFSPDSEAVMARIRIKPVSDTRSVVTAVVTTTKVYSDGTKDTSSQNKTETKPYVTTAWTALKSHDFRTDKCATPTVAYELSADGKKATVSVSTDDADARYCDIQLCTKSGSKYAVAKKKNDLACTAAAGAEYTFSLDAGKTYYLRAQIAADKKTKGASSWSAYQTVAARPAKPGKPTAQATGATGAKVTWKAVAGAASYRVQYVTGASSRFNTDPTAVTEVDGIIGLTFTPTGLDPAEKYWFRVAADNATGTSAWSTAASCTTALKPEAPTTYATDAAYIEGDTALLQWVHNAEDGSDQTAYQVKVDVYAPPSVGAQVIKTVSKVPISADGTFQLPQDFVSLAEQPWESAAYADIMEANPSYGADWYKDMFCVNGTDGEQHDCFLDAYLWHDFVSISGSTATIEYDYILEVIAGLRDPVIRTLSYYTNHTEQTISGTTAQEAEFDTSGLPDGTDVAWKIRTKGAHASWSPWSAQRRFTVYEQPELECELRQGEGGSGVDGESPLTAYPLAVTLDASGGGNAPIAYHAAISTAEYIQYTDAYGMDRWLAAGSIVWEGDFPTGDDPLTVLVDGGSALLTDGGSYTVTATVAMESGLAAAAQASFAVAFEADLPEPGALVVFDPDTLTADISPYCMAVDGNGDPTDGYREGTVLAVYRITADGDLILLRAGIANTGAATVTDPHAPFGECWYHIVATDSATGICSFADAMDESPHNRCVIQFDEQWQQAGPEDYGDGGPIYGGVLIDGFYNLEFAEQGDVQAEDIAYIGREDPVSYYGTQTGYTASYRMAFPRDDAETLSKMRALMRLRDDAYIREPSGTGFWAHVRTTLSRRFDNGAYEATVEATRVDRDDAALEEE